MITFPDLTTTPSSLNIFLSPIPKTSKTQRPSNLSQKLTYRTAIRQRLLPYAPTARISYPPTPLTYPTLAQSSLDSEIELSRAREARSAAAIYPNSIIST